MRKIGNHRVISSKLLAGWSNVYIYQRSKNDESLILTSTERKGLVFLAKVKSRKNGTFTIPKKVADLGWQPGIPYTIGGNLFELYMIKFPPEAIRFTKE